MAQNKMAQRENGPKRKLPKEELSHGKNRPGRKRPSSVLSITESFKTFPLVISVFQIKICNFMQYMQNFDFSPELAQLRFKHHRVI